jgi:hypothetical protein
MHTVVGVLVLLVVLVMIPLGWWLQSGGISKRRKRRDGR